MAELVDNVEHLFAQSELWWSPVLVKERRVGTATTTRLSQIVEQDLRILRVYYELYSVIAQTIETVVRRVAFLSQVLFQDRQYASSQIGILKWTLLQDI